MKAMQEQEVETCFKKHRTAIYKKHPKKTPMDNTQTDTVGKAYLGSKFLGTFSQDKVPLGRTGFIMANTDVSGKPGVHWVGIYSTPKTVYIYDSYGRPSDKLLKLLTKKAKDKNIRIKDSDLSDAEQYGSGKTSSYCGQSSLAWMFCVNDVGIKNALKI